MYTSVVMFSCGYKGGLKKRTLSQSEYYSHEVFEDADNSLDFKLQDKTSNNLKTSTTPFQIFWY